MDFEIATLLVPTGPSLVACLGLLVLWLFVGVAFIHHGWPKEISSGFPFIAPDPFQNPKGDYAGPMGVGEPTSWEKAAMYVVMCGVLASCGGGLFSLDNLLIADILKTLLG